MITWTKREPAEDENGAPVTVWDRVTLKEHPTTGEMVPDETARVPVYEYSGVRKAKWPDADFVVGNPPFIGGKDIRAWHGDGYALAIRSAYDEVPESADFVMYWWQCAAELARAGKLLRFGFVTTNSITQVFDRRVVAQNLNATKDPISIVFAIPDHPWLKALSAEEEAATRHAAVRIAMKVLTLKEPSPQSFPLIFKRLLDVILLPKMHFILASSPVEPMSAGLSPVGGRLKIDPATTRLVALTPIRSRIARTHRRKRFAESPSGWMGIVSVSRNSIPV